MNFIVLNIFFIFVGVRAVVPLQFERWERWPGGALALLGIANIIAHAFD